MSFRCRAARLPQACAQRKPRPNFKTGAGASAGGVGVHRDIASYCSSAIPPRCSG
ncbi:hypothetical protein KCP74_03950 [Salmonella enterica subsp. enterica]|nr:hypothetical protein KCP74_03950 [Salmonella enterica subsp. enterica]